MLVPRDFAALLLKEIQKRAGRDAEITDNVSEMLAQFQRRINNHASH
jgi:hypothetical protein